MAAGANVYQGITWGGQNYRYSSTADGNVQTMGGETVLYQTIVEGKVKFTINASEAVLVTW